MRASLAPDAGGLMPGGLAAVVTAARVVDGVGRGLWDAVLMFWDTLWALVLGFGLSGVLQAFATQEAVRARLGDHRPAAVARAGLFGALSSSCSYAASAMARSLFAGGADFVTVLVFLVASTNLVIELGVALVALIGWQLLAAELVGGSLMLVLLAGVGSLCLRGRALDEARRHVAGSPDGSPGHAPGSAPDGAGTEPPARSRIRSVGGWSDAAAYTMGDLTMLRRELLIGFVAAGLLAGLVPLDVWHAVFVHGHGVWTALENAAVGPLVAVVSFVCSVGNVPLAAALWHGGVSFGGVVSFVFADLISFPLLLVYRRHYGWRMALRMLLVLWAVMSLAGLATEGLFRLAGWVPATRPVAVARDGFASTLTTAADVVALVAFAGLYVLYRNRDRLGGGSGYATDPVCGMQVRRRHAPATLQQAGRTWYFCSEHCRDRFAASAGRSPVPGS